MDEKIVGIVGGGVMSRLLVIAAQQLSCKTAVVDPDGSLSPAGQLADLTLDVEDDYCAKLRELAAIADLITIENERLDSEVLDVMEDLCEGSGAKFQPAPSTFRLLQDRYHQKCHFLSMEFPVENFVAVSKVEDLATLVEQLGFPFLLKKRRFQVSGDACNVSSIGSEAEFLEFFRTHAMNEDEWYAEKVIASAKEISVAVANTPHSGAIIFPVTEILTPIAIHHRNTKLSLTITPAKLSAEVLDEVLMQAKRAVSAFAGFGVYSVHMFVRPDDTILLHKVVPRLHHSGNYSIDGCTIDQFSLHLRAILDLPCPQPKLKSRTVISLLVSGDSPEADDFLSRGLSLQNGAVRWYCGPRSRDLLDGGKLWKGQITLIGEAIEQFGDDFLHLGVDQDVFRHYLVEISPHVGIIAESRHDLVMAKEVLSILTKYNVTAEVKLLSARHSPEMLMDYIRYLPPRGVKLLLVVSNSNHLPISVASQSSLPVIFWSTAEPSTGNESIFTVPSDCPLVLSKANSGSCASHIVRCIACCDRLVWERLNELALLNDAYVAKSNLFDQLGIEEFLKHS